MTAIDPSSLSSLLLEIGISGQCSLERGKLLVAAASRIAEEVAHADIHLRNDPTVSSLETLRALLRVEVILRPDDNDILHCSPACEEADGDEHIPACPVAVHLSIFQTSMSRRSR